MSSQGATTFGEVSYIGFTPDAQTRQPVTAGYEFDTHSLRDASDWIAAKKQQLIRSESKAVVNQTTWFKRGNDYRIQAILGRTKCVVCPAGAFNQGAA